MDCGNDQANIISPSPPPSDANQGNDVEKDQLLNRNGSVCEINTDANTMGSSSLDHHASSSPSQPSLPSLSPQPSPLLTPRTYLHHASPAIPGPSQILNIMNRSNEIHHISSILSQIVRTSDRFSRSTMSAMERLEGCGWYWGPLGKVCAAKLLESEPNGSFLVRDNPNQNYLFTLTSKSNEEIFHTKLEPSQEDFNFGLRHSIFGSNSIADYIEDLIDHSQTGTLKFFLHRDHPRHGLARLRLTNPISRFKKMRSLKHMSRFVILRHVRRDNVRLLPLPESLKAYLCDSCHYREIEPEHHAIREDYRYHRYRY